MSRPRAASSACSTTLAGDASLPRRSIDVDCGFSLMRRSGSGGKSARASRSRAMADLPTSRSALLPASVTVACACRRSLTSRRDRYACSTLPAWRTSALLKRTKSERSAERLQRSVSPGASAPSSVPLSSRKRSFMPSRRALVVPRQAAPALEVVAQLLRRAGLGRARLLVGEVRGGHVARHRHGERMAQLLAQRRARRGTPDVDEVGVMPEAEDARRVGRLMHVLLRESKIHWAGLRVVSPAVHAPCRDL